MDSSTSIQELKEEEEENTTSITKLKDSNDQTQKYDFAPLDEISRMDIISEKNDYNSYIIKPPPSREIFRNKIKNLFVDSRDRNYNIYPTASKFEVPLKEEYKYVKSINLVMAQIPNSQYLINNSNNQLEYYIGNNSKGDTETLYIETGMYPDANPVNNYVPNIVTNLENIISTITQNIIYRDLLSIEIQGKFNASLNKCTQSKPSIEISYNSVKDNYVFNSDLAPLNCEAYSGEKLNLCFKGKEEPHGPQEIDKVPKINNYDRIERNAEGNIVYETISIGEKRNVYKKNTIGKIIGFGINNYDGYVLKGINNIDNHLIFKVNNITEENKNFTNNIEKNIYILLEENIDNIRYYQRFKIKNILNGYSFEIYDPNNNETGMNAPLVPPENPNIDGGIHIFTDASLYSGKINSIFRKDFTLDRYAILKIRGAYKIDSENNAAQNSFGIIPFDLILNNIRVNDYSKTLWVRSFNPPLAKLSELYLDFVNYDGSPYNFEGQEVSLQFVIETLNQSIKYGS